MKRLLPLLLCSGLALGGLGLLTLPPLGTAAAAPRLGAHDGYTRLVFDLPGPSTVSRQQRGPLLTLTLQVPLKAETGTLHEPGALSYRVQGKQITLRLSGSGAASVLVLPAGGGQPDRLVVDVPLIAPPQAKTPASIPALPVGQAATPVIRPVSTAHAAPLTVVLDAGHGGVDSGMSSPWVVEKEVTLDVALRVRRYLQAQGVHVIMVRTSDTQLSVDKKTDLERRSRLATAGTVNAYVSIHVNSGSSAASGIETYYFGETLNGSNRSLAVRENGSGSIGQELTRQASTAAQGLVGDLLSQAKLAFSAQLARSIQAQLITRTSADNRGVKSAELYVIKNPTVPAILTEVGFGTSPSEGARLAQASYRDKLAAAIANGILKFLKVE